MKKSLANPVSNLDELVQNGDEDEDEADEESFYWEDSPILGNGGERRRGVANI